MVDSNPVSYAIAFNYLMLWEDSHPQSGKVTLDAGGYTQYGISSNAYPVLKARLMSGTLSLEEASDIYYRDYWETAWEKLYDTQAIANKLFQMKVNLGEGTFHSIMEGVSFIFSGAIPDFKSLCVAQIQHYTKAYAGFDNIPSGLKRRALG